MHFSLLGLLLSLAAFSNFGGVLSRALVTDPSTSNQVKRSPVETTQNLGATIEPRKILKGVANDFKLNTLYITAYTLDGEKADEYHVALFISGPTAGKAGTLYQISGGSYQWKYESRKVTDYTTDSYLFAIFYRLSLLKPENLAKAESKIAPPAVGLPSGDNNDVIEAQRFWTERALKSLETNQIFVMSPSPGFLIKLVKEVARGKKEKDPVVEDKTRSYVYPYD